MKNKLFLVLSALLVLVGLYFFGSQVYKSKQAEKVTGLSQDEKGLFERDYSQSTGPSMARVTLVEYLDPECESCREFYPYVKELLKEFEGSVRFVVRYAPFHKNSQFAVKILEAAALQGKYWETLELFFKYQPNWGDHHHPKPELLWTYLPEVGLDIAKIKKDMNSPRIAQIIEQDIQDGTRLGVRRTPTFFVNGKPLMNFGFEPLRQLIKSELKD